ncbi:MAG: peptidoglycan DD-metalloendopeptidase family protein [Microscillaceae bacterium]|nr:peptidoglycan DD-metalloendopeptidase family protein [Microscillaceae bacterium]
MLAQIQTQSRVGLGELSLVQAQLQVQGQLIRVLEKELDTLNRYLRKLQIVVSQLTRYQDQLKGEYARMIYQSAKPSRQPNLLLFVFSAPDFHQLYRRWQYLRQYAQARREQVVHLQQVKQLLEEKERQLKDYKDHKDRLHQAKKTELSTLETLSQEKKRLLQQLAQQEKQLRQELLNNQRKLAQLDKLITDQVQSASRPSRPVRPRPVENTPSLQPKTTQPFARQKGKLAFPVQQGFIAVRFGRQKHPVLDKVYIDNAGIDIQASSGQEVQAAYAGEVSTIATIPGMGGQVLMLQHGEYFTVYARIKNIRVKIGDWIETGTPLAEVYTDASGLSRLQFQVWKGSQKLNPEEWLRRR